MEESALIDVSSDQLLPGRIYVSQYFWTYTDQCMNLTKVMISHAKTPFGVKKVQSSKVESYVEVNV